MREHQPLARGETRGPRVTLRAVVGGRVLRMARQERAHGGDVGFRALAGTDGCSSSEFVVDKIVGVLGAQPAVFACLRAPT